MISEMTVEVYMKYYNAQQQNTDKLHCFYAK